MFTFGRKQTQYFSLGSNFHHSSLYIFPHFLLRRLIICKITARSFLVHPTAYYITNSLDPGGMQSNSASDQDQICLTLGQYILQKKTVNLMHFKNEDWIIKPMTKCAAWYKLIVCLLTLSSPNKLLSAKLLVCLNFQSASMSLKISENVVWMSKSLDPDDSPSYSASHPDSSSLHIWHLACAGRAKD